jgi:23S rRNA (adenine-N6)-dimethyltransferase
MGRHERTPAVVHKSKTERDRSRRVLAQNFLRDPYTIDQVVHAVRLAPNDLVLEVGAGEGLLTRALARKCRRVLAYEIDPALAAALAAQTRDEPRIHCIPADFLAARTPLEPFAVVGNIPYGITSQVVDWCLSAPGRRSATLVTQLEYARKRTGDYGRWTLLTVLSWPRFHWRLAGRIPRERFRPVPRVDSGILRLERRPVELLPERLLPAYERFVELGFSGLGGSLHASLCRRHPARRVSAAFRANRLDAAVPVGFVWPEQWLALFRALHASDLRAWTT